MVTAIVSHATTVEKNIFGVRTSKSFNSSHGANSPQISEQSPPTRKQSQITAQGENVPVAAEFFMTQLSTLVNTFLQKFLTLHTKMPRKQISA